MPAKASTETRLQATDRVLLYQGTLIEIPMNEELLPDRSGTNPLYDPEYLYAWGSYRNQGDVSLKLAQGYRLVDPQELEEKLPENYRHALRVEGRYLVFGDLVLMKIHRADKARLDEGEHQKAIAHLKTAGQDSLGNLPTAQRGKNEVILRAE